MNTFTCKENSIIETKSLDNFLKARLFLNKLCNFNANFFFFETSSKSYLIMHTVSKEKIISIIRK